MKGNQRGKKNSLSKPQNAGEITTEPDFNGFISGISKSLLCTIMPDVHTLWLLLLLTALIGSERKLIQFNPGN